MSFVYDPLCDLLRQSSSYDFLLNIKLFAFLYLVGKQSDLAHNLIQVSYFSSYKS